MLVEESKTDAISGENMSHSGNLQNGKDETQVRFWGSLARAAVPIARNLLSLISADRGRAEGPVIRGLGPIKWDSRAQEYENQDDGKVILHFSSVNGQGHVDRNALDQIIFEGRARRPLRDIQALVERNLAGYLSWSFVGTETIKAFVEISNWDGQATSIFIDGDPSNDLVIRINLSGSEIVIENPTEFWDYQLNFILVDSAGVTFQSDVALPASSWTQKVCLGEDFTPLMPIEKIYVSGTATWPQKAES